MADATYGWLAPTEHYTRHVANPATTERAAVVLRPLSAGDVARLQSLRVTDEGGEVSMGAMRLATIERAVVSWELPIPLTAEAIARLNPAIVNQLYALVSLDGVIPEQEEDDGPLAEATWALNVVEPTGASG